MVTPWRAPGIFTDKYAAAWLALIVDITDNRHCMPTHQFHARLQPAVGAKGIICVAAGTQRFEVRVTGGSIVNIKAHHYRFVVGNGCFYIGDQLGLGRIDHIISMRGRSIAGV